MATEETEAKKPRLRKKPADSMRDKAAKTEAKQGKPKRFKSAASTALKPAKTAANVGKKQYFFVKPRDKGIVGFFTKPRRWVPKYVRESFIEVKQVTFPGRRESWKLVGAVFIFATTFAAIIGVVDFLLDKLFRRILL